MVFVTVGVLVDLVTVRAGKQLAPGDAPGICAAVTVPVTPVAPATEPYVLALVVVTPCDPPLTLTEPGALDVKTAPPPPPPPGPW